MSKLNKLASLLSLDEDFLSEAIKDNTNISARKNMVSTNSKTMHYKEHSGTFDEMKSKADAFHGALEKDGWVHTHSETRGRYSIRHYSNSKKPGMVMSTHLFNGESEHPLQKYADKKLPHGTTSLFSVTGKKFDAEQGKTQATKFVADADKTYMSVLNKRIKSGETHQQKRANEHLPQMGRSSKLLKKLLGKK